MVSQKLVFGSLIIISLFIVVFLMTGSSETVPKGRFTETTMNSGYSPSSTNYESSSSTIYEYTVSTIEEYTSSTQYVYTSSTVTVETSLTTLDPATFCAIEDNDGKCCGADLDEEDEDYCCMHCADGECKNSNSFFYNGNWFHMNCGASSSTDKDYLCKRCVDGDCANSPDGLICGEERGCSECSSGSCEPALTSGEKCPENDYNCGKCNSDGECEPDSDTSGEACLSGYQAIECCVCDEEGEPNYRDFDMEDCGDGDDLKCYSCFRGMCNPKNMDRSNVYCGMGKDLECKFCEGDDESASCSGSVEDGETCRIPSADDDSIFIGTGTCESGECEDPCDGKSEGDSCGPEGEDEICSVCAIDEESGDLTCKFRDDVYEDDSDLECGEEGTDSRGCKLCARGECSNIEVVRRTSPFVPDKHYCGPSGIDHTCKICGNGHCGFNNEVNCGGVFNRGCKICDMGSCLNIQEGQNPLIIDDLRNEVLEDCAVCNSGTKSYIEDGLPCTADLDYYDNWDPGLCGTCQDYECQVDEGMDYCGQVGNFFCYVCTAGGVCEPANIPPNPPFNPNPPKAKCGDGKDKNCKYCDDFNDCVDELNGKACQYRIELDDGWIDGWGHCLHGECIIPVTSTSGGSPSSTMDYTTSSTL